MIYYFDIDGTLCTNTNGDYKKAKPYKKRINNINYLYEEGNIIIFYTSRGSSTGIEWSKFTELQLKKWKVNYHKLLMGKPEYDVFVCDKAINSEDFFKGEK